jgi:hypothetical protein
VEAVFEGIPELSEGLYCGPPKVALRLPIRVSAVRSAAENLATRPLGYCPAPPAFVVAPKSGWPKFGLEDIVIDVPYNRTDPIVTFDQIPVAGQHLRSHVEDLHSQNNY